MKNTFIREAILGIAMFSGALLPFSSAHAALQTTAGVSCPFGYICTPISSANSNVTNSSVPTTVPIINYPAPAPVLKAAPAACFIFQRNLSIGTAMTSDEATNLNDTLTADNDPAILSTGNQFTSAHSQSVALYQKKHGLPSTGFFGPLTRASINATACRPLAITTSAVIPSTITTPVPISEINIPPVIQVTPVTQTAVQNFSYYNYLNTNSLCTTNAPQSQVVTMNNAASTPKLFDIDFGPQLPTPNVRKTGAAVVGNSGDYWNSVSVPYCDDHIRTGLKNADNSASSISVELTNLGGSWSSNGQLGLNDPMLDDFAYPANNKGGNAIVTLRNIPPGIYDLYLYNKTITASQNGDFTVNVGGRGYGQKLTSTDPSSPLATSWQEGNQYVKFAGVIVNGGETMTILLQPGVGVYHDSQISGLQLAPANTIVNPPPALPIPSIANLHIVDLATGQNTFGLHTNAAYKILWSSQNLTSPVVVSLKELQGTSWVTALSIGSPRSGTDGSITWSVPASFAASTNRYAIAADSGSIHEQVEVNFAASAPIQPIQPTTNTNSSGASVNLVPVPVPPPQQAHEIDPNVQPDTRAMAQ